LKLLILGADGMLGHKLFLILSRQFEVYATCRNKFGFERFITDNKLSNERIIIGVDANEFSAVSQVIDNIMPDVIVNCIGIVKQRKGNSSSVPSIRLNSLFPHLLAEKCLNQKIRLIHISTDCVFSGNKGNYNESDIPDPIDLYGRSKLLGEVDFPGCLTLRTSIVGWELKNRLSLLEWFAAQRWQKIKGFRKAIYSGVSTAILANITGNILTNFPKLSGIYHVASEPISKYDLLVKLKNELGWSDPVIEPEDNMIIDRSLNSEKFFLETGWKAPSWDIMIKELAEEWPLYEQWR